MKLNQFGCAIVLVAGLLGSGMAGAGNADFTLVNKTGETLREIYISASKKSHWGPDRLGQNYLEPNQARLFTFSDKASCLQDLKVVFDDDDAEVTWENLDLCVLNKVTLKYNRKSGVVSADTE
jgi:hypothetical protein